MRAIAAIYGNDHLLGVDGRLPGKSKQDMERFVSLTRGHPCLLGMGTFLGDLRGKALKGNRPLHVLCRWDRMPAPVEGVTFYDAAQPARVLEAVEACGDDGWCIGGAVTYAAMAQHIDELHLSLFRGEEAEEKALLHSATRWTPYPLVRPRDWHLISQEWAVDHLYQVFRTAHG